MPRLRRAGRAPRGRREHLLHDAPFGHRQVQVAWRKRVWRCLEPAYSMVTFTETHQLAAPPAVLTRRAVLWAADALTHDDTTVSALACRLDAHIWRPSKCGAGREVTCMVGPATRTARFGPVCSTWSWAGPGWPTPAGATAASRGPLLARIDVTGAIITPDALPTQRAHAAYLSGRGVHYC